ncbi:MAG: nitroreductase [Chloroflexi bacterium]|nr:nitroreductase [Chloroflexota bacterium]
MDFSELISKRYSVRSYLPKAVEDEKLTQVLESMRLAPTAKNLQPFRIIIIHTAGKEEQLKKIYRPDWFVSAPLVICVCAVIDEAWVRRDGKCYVDVDVAIAVDHMTLMAANLGLGTCWIANFDLEAAREFLGTPESVIPLIFSPLGYPADEPKPKQRKPLSDLVRYEHW